MPESATVSVRDAAEILGISKTFAYELIEAGEFPVPVLTLRSRKLVPRRALMAYIDGPGPNQATNGSSGTGQDTADTAA